MIAILLVALLAIICPALAIPTISAKGSKLFLSTGDQFYIKGGAISPCSNCRAESTDITSGIAYQLVDDDPLIDTAQCQRDADLMQSIGANSIRVYHVDANANHDGCMKTFADAGIYTWM